MSKEIDFSLDPWVTEIVSTMHMLRKEFLVSEMLATLGMRTPQQTPAAVGRVQRILDKMGIPYRENDYNGIKVRVYENTKFVPYE